MQTPFIISQQSTVNTLRPVYDLVELGLDDYEENKLVLNTIHNLKLFFKNPDNCTCHRTPKQKDLRTCFEKVEFKCFFERHFKLKALEEYELELFIKSQLMSFEISNEKSINKTQKHIYRYNYNNSLFLCKLTKRVHGNTGHVSKTESRVFLDFNITFTIKQFLIQYGIIHRLSSPLCSEIRKVYASKKSGREKTSFQLLHNIKFDENSNLNAFSTILLSNDHKKYLYTKIRQHVDDPYKDILCPQP
ncbi:7707_t:CDS:2 [Dentiscutata heterogama]|uniref:7707_t:CDS:1 n=1 Tax=Dentiscutata heterogama TaxID=1316150 RepID=A0ACA9LNL3_9GLOM|nr:7707_t:CDS:2 [Dentiscutata heterogama]